MNRNKFSEYIYTDNLLSLHPLSIGQRSRHREIQYLVLFLFANRISVNETKECADKIPQGLWIKTEFLEHRIQI